MVFCNKLHEEKIIKHMNCHNPYFNRWFSAIYNRVKENYNDYEVTILILIDGFLQSNKGGEDRVT
mgnify:CR=1 FL=1